MLTSECTLDPPPPPPLLPSPPLLLLFLFFVNLTRACKLNLHESASRPIYLTGLLFMSRPWPHRRVPMGRAPMHLAHWFGGGGRVMVSSRLGAGDEG